MSTYAEFIEKPISEKIILAHVEPSQELLLWTLDSGAVYSKVVPYYVISAKQNATELTEGSSSSLSAGEWWFDSSTYTLYVRMSDDSTPQNKTSATYRLFFSSQEITAPFDLNTGASVIYDGYLNKISSFSKRLDDEQIGISLESKGSIDFINTSGYFDDLYDILFWENKNIKIYSYSRELNSFSQSQKLFEGIVTNKSYSDKIFKLNIADFIHKLRDPFNLPLFSSSDGTLDDSTIGKPKRRLYGQFEGIKCIPIDAALDGFTITGTVAGNIGDTFITGTGTSFTTEFLQGDSIVVGDNEFTIDAVTSNTNINISDEIADNFSGLTAKNRSSIPSTSAGRSWHVAGHKLREPTTTVVSSAQANRVTVADITDFEVGSIINISSDYRTVSSINGSELVLTQNLSANPSFGTTVTRSPVSKVFANKVELTVGRDYTVTNTASDCIVVLDALAEFNIARIRTLGSVTFTLNDRTVTAGAGVNFEASLVAGDWLQSSDISHTTWYRISSITDETNLELDTDYLGATDTGVSKFRNPEYLDERSNIGCDCLGLENTSSEWVKTASQAVKDILERDAVITNVDTDSFDESEALAFYKLSLAIPERPLSKSPKIRDGINRINKSVFGSLVTLSNFDIAYNVLDPEIPEDLETIKDDDILNFSVKSKMDIVRKVKGNYKHFDLSQFITEDGNSVYEYVSDFVDNNIGVNKELETDIYLFETAWAEIIVQRYALINSLTQSTVQIKSKLKFALKNLNEKMYIVLDRIYKRFGSQDRKKVGIISRIDNNGADMTVEFQDLGNIFNRVPVLAPTTANDFASATDNELVRYGHVCDNTLEIPDTSTEELKGSNIIG